MNISPQLPQLRTKKKPRALAHIRLRQRIRRVLEGRPPVANTSHKGCLR